MVYYEFVAFCQLHSNVSTASSFSIISYVVVVNNASAVSEVSILTE